MRPQWHALRAALLLIDAIAIATALGVASLIRFPADLPPLDVSAQPSGDLRPLPIQVLCLIPVCLLIFALHRLYDFDHLLNGMDEYVRIAQATSLSLMALIVAAFLAPTFVVGRGWLALAWMFSTLAVAGGRFAVRRWVNTARRRGRFMTPVLIIGANEEGRAMAEHLRESPAAGARVVGFLDDRVDEGREVVRGLRVLGPIDDAPNCVTRYGVGEVIVAASALTRAELLDVFQVFGRRDDVRLRLSSGLYELLTTGLRVKHMGSVALLTANRIRLSLAERVVKTAVDLALAGIALVALSPLLLVIALLIRLDSPGPIIFRRQVLGVGGKVFHALKFRTMVVDGDAVLARHPELARRLEHDMKLKDDPRVTRAGKWLRRLSLDELPQLVNVLLGQMSLVGPRMITPQEAEQYGPWQHNLLTVKPGMTGLWQISGRSDLAYAERVRIDMSYIRNYSLWLDLILLARTLPAVLKKTGAY